MKSISLGHQKCIKEPASMMELFRENSSRLLPVSEAALKGTHAKV